MDPFYFTELRQLVRLVIPVLIAQLIVVGMSFVDTLMAGQISALDLAGVAIGSSLLNPVVLFTQGVLLAVTPLVANHWGARRIPHIAATFIQSLWLAAALGVLAMLTLLMMPAAINLMPIDDPLKSLASDYLTFVAFGLPAFALYQALRGLNEGLANTRVIMIIGLVGIGVNIPLNYVFIHGIGVKAYGGAGCGIATTLVYWLMTVVFAIYIGFTQRYKTLNLFDGPKKPELTKLFKIIRLGLPIGGAVFIEVSLFSSVALLIAPLGTVVVAAHQIVLNFVSLIFMIPLSLSIVLTIRVGHLLGEKRLQEARKLSFMGVALGACIGLFTASLTVVFSEWVIDLYTQDSAVKEVAFTLFIVAVVLQFYDAIQIASAGVLRGYQDTRSIFIMTLICYWPIGMLAGCALCFTDWVTREPLGVIGFWYAKVIALVTVSILLGFRLYFISFLTSKGPPLARLSIDPN